MSGRSFLRSALLLGVISGGCTKAPEADPAKIEAIAKTIVHVTPPLAGTRKCVEADYELPAMTLVTAIELAKDTPPKAPEYARWINPVEIDAPAIRTLLESKDETARRRAAAQLLRAPGYIVYRVDMVNVPLALEVKELKRGAVGVRAVGFDKDGNVFCVRQFTVQNDKDKSEWAMSTSKMPTVDPAIAKALRDDLGVQMKDAIAQIMGGG